MLPQLVLDNEDFEDIMAEARNMIISLYPEWTDFNYHDPGITLIELFSWMKESQQFFMDQISLKNREKYLKLLGLRRRTKQPAKALVQVVPPDDLTVLAGTRLYAGEICFEAVKQKQLIRDDVICCFSAGEQPSQWTDKEPIKMGHNLHLFLFGEKPMPGNSFYLGFSHGLPEKQELDIHLELSDYYSVKRNPPAAGMPSPLAKIRLQYFSGGIWREAKLLRDETMGGIVSGHIGFSLAEPMEKAKVFEKEGYFLQLVLEQESYDVPPVLKTISANRLPLVQQRQVIEQQDQVDFEQTALQISCRFQTMAVLNGRNDLYIGSEGRYYRVIDFTKIPNFETGMTLFQFPLPAAVKTIDHIRVVSTMPDQLERKYLAQGNAFPDQEYQLNSLLTEYESFQIMVQETGNPDCYVPWTKVIDFSQSGPEDCHYILSAAGTVRFGDCFRGMAPEGDIIITSARETLGRGGNVKAYTINRFEGMEPEDILVFNRGNGQSGSDEETLEETFLRARKELKQSETAVSDRDYERYVMETPGLLLESCRVISASLMKQIKNDVDEAEVHIVVKPFCPDIESGLSDCYRRNILAHLESYRMVGRKINLLSPQYITFEIYADIVLCPHYIKAEEEVRSTLSRYFANIYNEFGVTVQYSELYGLIDRMECVYCINSLNIDVRGTGVLRSKDGTIKLPPNGVLRLGEVQYLFSTGE